jgi:hypothetical protein
MTNQTSFSAASARCIDRLEIAGRGALTPEKLGELTGLSAPPSVAAMIVGFMADCLLTWHELGLILRYVPEAHMRGMADQLGQAGVLDVAPSGVTYSAEGRRSAQAVVDLLPSLLDALWTTDIDRITSLVSIAEQVANAAVASGSASAQIIDGILRPTNPSPSFLLWHSLAKIRRYRADAHAAAWAEAGHTAESIQQLKTGPERNAIEQRTNELASPIWEAVSDAQRVQLLAGIAGLNGVGDPS